MIKHVAQKFNVRFKLEYSISYIYVDSHKIIFKKDMSVHIYYLKKNHKKRIKFKWNIIIGLNFKWNI